MGSVTDQPELSSQVFAHFRAEQPFALDSYQVAGCESLRNGRSVLVAAPTGAGKTLVGEFAIYLAQAEGRRAFYTTPIKALSNQKYGDLVDRFGHDKVGLLTGDVSINGDAAIVVMTTEVLRNMLYAGTPGLADLGYVVMDEVHYLADRFRGPVWEETILQLDPNVRLVALSATVSNVEEFGDWLNLVRGETDVVVSETRPVPLSQHMVVGDQLFDLYTPDTSAGEHGDLNPELAAAIRQVSNKPRKGYAGRGSYRHRGRGKEHTTRRRFPHALARPALAMLLDRNGLLPAIYFIFSREGCDDAVQHCLRSGLQLTSPEEARSLRSTARSRLAALTEEDRSAIGFGPWLAALESGIAAHHAGLLPAVKTVVEQLFSEGLVRLVFATETLSLGINMPARSVVLERLVKWDGAEHADITPGEFTQLTGRAGRRGIDIEGHAVVIQRSGITPESVAGLASRRTYPLTSSFRPTYNMAVNLLARSDLDTARGVLESSFAQFQTDRGVVGLARQSQAQIEALTGYREAMQCSQGDFMEYFQCRTDLKTEEKRGRRAVRAQQRTDIDRALSSLRPGAVIFVGHGRRTGAAVVIGRQFSRGDGTLRVHVLGVDNKTWTISMQSVSSPITEIGQIRIPKGFNGKVPGSRKDLAATLRNYLNSGGASETPVAMPRAALKPENHEIERLRTALREHPCHGCPHREDHARWAERWNKLNKEHQALDQRIRSRTNSIARVFERVCSALMDIDYLDPHGRVTDRGARLRRLYGERDLLIAQCIDGQVWNGLTPPQLAAAVSSVVFMPRRDDQRGVVLLDSEDTLAAVAQTTARYWREIHARELQRRVTQTPEPEWGLALHVLAWANGASLKTALRDSTIPVGDFVRWCLQIVDVLEQIGAAADTEALRKSTSAAVKAIKRGVIDFTPST